MPQMPNNHLNKICICLNHLSLKQFRLCPSADQYIIYLIYINICSSRHIRIVLLTKWSLEVATVLSKICNPFKLNMYFHFLTKPFYKQYIVVQNEVLLLKFRSCIMKLQTIIWATTQQNQQNECAPSKDSDQTGHPPSLIRVFAVHLLGS